MEREGQRVLHEVEQVGMRASELVFAMHSECVVPDDPAAALKADFLSRHFQFRRVFVSNGQPECSRGNEQAMELLHPLSTPLNVLILLQPIIVLVIIVPDIERRVGEGQVNALIRKSRQSFEAVAVVDAVERLCA
jgi:hypothetical protein